jgi:peptide/nickel transport system substrate-binding protein
MFAKKWNVLLALVVVGMLVLAACQPQTVIVEKPVEVTKVVKEEVEVTKIVEKEVEKQVTKIVEKEVEVEVTPTPTPIPQGGFLNLTSFADADILSSLLSSDSASADIEGYIFSAPFMTDPWTGETIPNMVESWDVTDQNKTVTFHVRQGIKWSDGEPITANDFKFMFDALMATDEEGSPVLAESPRLDMVEYVDTIELIDDYTLKVTYTEGICTNFESLSLVWLPSHVFLSDPDFEFADLVDHEFNWEPTVFSGPFMFQEWVKDDHITLVRNPDYWKGAAYLDGIVWKVVANATVEKEMMKAGETDLIGLDPKYLTEMEQVENIDIYKFFRTAYDYIGLQRGDPENPQPRMNEDGSVNEEHGAHPILSKKQVRQALVYAVDRTSIINKVRMGQAAPIEAHIIPTYGWAYNDQLEPREFDPEKAAQMLEEAGWVLEEGAEVRVCKGCGTAPDGTPMKLNLKTNSGNEVRENIMVIVQQQWGDIGIEVETEAMEWNAYLDVLLGQNFDAVIIGWTGVDPDSEVLFFAKYDVPGGGFNFCSFYRPDYEPLELEAKTVEGCAYEDRGAIYKEIQEIFYDELPYVFLYATRAITVINQRIGGVNPAPWSTTYNIHEWFIKSE